YNTVCRNTIDRQTKAASLAEKVDAMIVIGGKNSANTSRLADVCGRINSSTYHIEHAGNLKTTILKNKKSIGIAAGASTPPYAINEVIKKIRRIDQQW
ncbi:MAG: bifunctional 4-hydroxy-3-methylbut-2-enyl diphosphate reductase/30S ribosomal protein S1, partial [Candidatus Omnitrophota bacterium]